MHAIMISCYHAINITSVLTRIPIYNNYVNHVNYVNCINFDIIDYINILTVVYNRLSTIAHHLLLCPCTYVNYVNYVNFYIVDLIIDYIFDNSLQ